MKLRSLKTVFVVCALLTATVSQAQDLNAGALLSRNAVHRIPFGPVKHELRDTAVLRGQRHIFILDTGAPLCISRTIQAREQYPVLHTARLRDANGRADSTQVVEVDTLRLGELVFVHIPAVVLDLAGSPLGKDGIDGIIGGNVLRFLLVRFDAQRHEVLLADRPEAVGFDAAQAHPAWLDGQSNFALMLGIGDCYTDTVQVDSGMGDALLLDQGESVRLLADCSAEQVRHLGSRKGRTAGVLGRDPSAVERYRTNVLTLGGQPVRDSFTFLGTNGGSRLGRDLLARGVCILDYPGARYSFVPYGK